MHTGDNMGFGNTMFGDYMTRGNYTTCLPERRRCSLAAADSFDVPQSPAAMDKATNVPMLARWQVASMDCILAEALLQALAAKRSIRATVPTFAFAIQVGPPQSIEEEQAHDLASGLDSQVLRL